ncbi:MAG: hypothetical protein ABII79_04215 [bacterium]
MTKYEKINSLELVPDSRILKSSPLKNEFKKHYRNAACYQGSNSKGMIEILMLKNDNTALVAWQGWNNGQVVTIIADNEIEALNKYYEHIEESE